MEYFEPEHHGFEFEVEQSWILYVFQALIFPKDGDQGLVVQGEDEVVQAKDKEFAFEQTMDGSQRFALDGMIPGFCWGAEFTPTVDSVPSIWATARYWLLASGAFAMFLG